MAEPPEQGGQSKPQPGLPHRQLQRSTPHCKPPGLLPSAPMGCRDPPTAGRAEGREAGSRARVWEQRGGGADPAGSPWQAKVRTGWEQMGPALLVKEAVSAIYAKRWECFSRHFGWLCNEAGLNMPALFVLDN